MYQQFVQLLQHLVLLQLHLTLLCFEYVWLMQQPLLSLFAVVALLELAAEDSSAQGSCCRWAVAT